MKRFLAFVLTLISITSNAQVCNVNNTDTTFFKQQPWIGNNQYLLQIQDSLWSGQNILQKANSGGYIENRVLYIPIRAWVWRDNAGTNRFDEADVEWYIRQLNEDYFNSAINSTQIYFYLKCAPTFVNNNSVREYPDQAKRSWVFDNYREQYVLNVHFVREMTDGGGFGVLPWSPNQMSLIFSTLEIRSSDFANNLAHEVGHTLGLLHPHEGTDVSVQYNYNEDASTCKQEFVSRSATNTFLECLNTRTKCAWYADGLCDTEADPGLWKNGNSRVGYDATLDEWVYTGGGTDKDDPPQSWDPDLDLIMSYSNIALKNRFSPMQITVMHSYANNSIPVNYTGYLVNNKDPEIDIYEPNNHLDNSSASELFINHSIQATFHRTYSGLPSLNGWSACDQDWYRINPSISVKVNIETNAILNQANPDTKISIFHSSDLNSPIATNDNISITNLFSALNEIELTGGEEYYLLVEAKGTIGHYELHVSDCGTQCCFNDVLDNTTVIDGSTGPFNVGVRIQGQQEYVGNNIAVFSQLNFNINAPIGFGPTLFPVQQSHLDAFLCNSAIINIENGGAVILGDPLSGRSASVTLGSGTLMRLKNGSNLKINDGSTIIIEEGANFIFEDGATIELLGSDAELVIKGKVTVGDNATLTFSGSGHMVIDQLIYDGVYNNFWQIGQNAKLKLDGWPSRGTVLECRSNFVPKMQNQHTFSEVEIRMGNVLMHPNTQISTHAPLTMYLANLQRAGTTGYHNGLALWGQTASIAQCSFKHAYTGINAEQTWATQALTINASSFTENQIGLATRGKNAVITASTFSNNSGGGWQANQMSGTSQVVNSTFNNPSGISGIYFEGQQGATLLASGNTFSNSEAGIFVETATLTPSCNTFNNLSVEGIYCLESNLYLNEEKYNLFNNNQSGITIQNGDGGNVFFMEQGHNEFILGNAGYNHLRGYFGSGSILNMPTSTQLDADNNKMEIISIGNFSGPPVDIDLGLIPFGVTALTLHIPNNLTAITSNCSGSSGAGAVLEEELTLQSLSSFKTINTALYQNTNLLTALLDAVGDVSTDMQEEQDLLAIDKLYQILTYNIGTTTADEDAMLEISYKVMIKALNFSFAYGNLQLNRAEPNTLIDGYTDKLIAVINYRLSKLNILAATYESERFRLNLDVAHVYRLAEYYDQAISQLQTSYNWAIQMQHQQRANYWLCVCEAERAFLLEEISPESFSIAQQNCQSLWTAKRDFETARKTGQNIGTGLINGSLLRVYPNPANQFVTVQWLGAENNLTCQLLTLSGQVVSSTAQHGQARFIMPLPASLPQGIYLLKVSDGSSEETVKLSVLR